jgi:hypothetical protein
MVPCCVYVGGTETLYQHLLSPQVTHLGRLVMGMLSGYRELFIQLLDRGLSLGAPCGGKVTRVLHPNPGPILSLVGRIGQVLV